MLQLPGCGCGVPVCWGREKRRCRGLKPYAPLLLWLIARRCQVVGSEERPRLAVFRSNQHIYAAEKCKEKGIEMVVFDRGGFKYHGRISVRAPLRVH